MPRDEHEPAESMEVLSAVSPELRGDRSWVVRLVWVVTFMAFAAPVLLVLLGQETLFFRDVSNLHLPAKWAQAESWRQGHVPVLDDQRAGGQPSLGNPNFLPLYPDNLLYLVGSSSWAFNAHFALHWLLLPLSAFWLGRVLGLKAQVAWAFALFYGTSGWAFSQLNFYNLLTVAALAPALLATLLSAARAASSRRLATLALLWGLILLAGDPISALMVLVSGLLLVAVLEPDSWRRPKVRTIGGIAAALLVGVMLGAPQHIEFLRALPESYRSYIGYSAAGSLVGSWDPRQLLEWLVPFAFGRPDQSFWGARFSGGAQPFYFSLYPGVLVLGALTVALCGAPKTRSVERRLWLLALLAMALGVFIALGSHNPFVRWLAGAGNEWLGGLLRFPIKAWLLVVLATSYLAARGVERTFVFARGEYQRRFPPVLVAFSLLAALHLLLLLVLRTPLGRGWIADLAQREPTHERVEVVLAQWSGGVAWATCAVLGYCVLVWWHRRRLGNALDSKVGTSLPLLLCVLVHVSTQVLLMSPLHPTDDAAAYETPSPLLAALDLSSPDGFDAPATVIQGNQFEAFGPSSRNIRYPDERALWVQRRGAIDLFPSAGVRFGVHYETNVSADGLDHFASLIGLTALRSLEDPQRIRLLQSWSVDWLILDRPLRGVPPSAVERVGRLERFHSAVALYRMRGQAPAALVSASVRSVETVGEVREVLLDADFDPQRDVVLLGSSFAARGAPGRVLSYEERDFSGDRVTVEVEAVTDSVLMLARAYQPHYRVTVDGEERRSEIANLSRLAVVVPEGRHTVEFIVTKISRAWWLIAAAMWLLCLVGVIAGAPGSQ